MQDRLQQKIQQSFKSSNQEQKYNEYVQLLNTKGINNWDDGLIGLEKEDLIELGVPENDAITFAQEIKKRRDEFKEYSVKSIDAQSVVSYKKNVYTEEKIEHELNRLYDIYSDVNNNCFNQFPDLCKITFLAFISQEKMLFIGPSSTNIEDLFKQFTIHLDVQEQQIYNHLITQQTTIEELFSDQNMKSLQISTSNRGKSETNLQDAKYIFLHQIFQANSPVMNALIKKFQDLETKTVYATAEIEPEYKNFDVIIDEFLITYFNEEEADTKEKEKTENFDDLIDAMWGSNKDVKMKSPQKKNQKPSGNTTKIPVSFNKGTRINPDALTILVEESFEKVEDNSGLLKLYLKLLREALIKQKIFVSQKKWMKIFKILKLVAYTRNAGDRKKMCLSDCFLIPYFIAKSKIEFNITEQINLDLLENLTRTYGSQRLQAVLDKHFWLMKWQKSQIKEIRKRHVNLPSFFNGCLQHPESYQIITENMDIGVPQIYYSCKGGDKKILSDEYIQIDPGRAYELKIDLRTSDEMIMYVGLVCFDQNKEFIHSTQVNRIEGSQVVIESDNDEKQEIYVTKETTENLLKWNSFDAEAKDKSKNFSYLRSIGVYDDGDINKFITLDKVLQDTVNPYGDTTDNGIYSKVQGNTIRMTKMGYEKYQALKQKNLIEKKKTALMNHFEGGTYAFAECFDEYIKKWITKSYWFKGESRGTETNKFRKGTKFVKIVILSNYNSGFPDFKITNKDASVFWKNIEFKPLK